MKQNKWRGIGSAFPLFFASTGWVYASGDGGHPGDNQIIVSDSFGLLFTFFKGYNRSVFRGREGSY